MAVLVNVTGPTVSQVSYPCILIDPETNLVLFMNGWQCGTVLQGGSTNYLAGYHGTNWKMHKLLPFHGRVTLENQ